MKTTKAQFNRFKREFLRGWRLLGLTHYALRFVHHLDEQDSYAMINVDEPGKVALISMAHELRTELAKANFSPENTAWHEVFHLLTWRLCWLGEGPETTKAEINDECEAVARRLEHFLSLKEKG